MNNNDILFDFDNYDDFLRERLKLNHENTLKFWYSLPENLNNINHKYFKEKTIKQQKKTYKKLKYFSYFSSILNKTFIKKRIHSKGFYIWNKTFNIPSLDNENLYSIYKSLGYITNEFINKGKTYDLNISDEELYKAGRTVWFMIAFQIQIDSPLKLTDSIFGYNMLYPYTDDFIDSNSISKQSKKDFNYLFYHRLLYGDMIYLDLPKSLEEYRDKIKKIFDMVKFIENDWIRDDRTRSIYMSLTNIHQSQMKSTKQQFNNQNSNITMNIIEEITAEKGGASLIAAAYLVEGKLTKEKFKYLEFLGFALQLLDDLQDFDEDLKNNHRTIFTQTYIDGNKLDKPTARLIQYCYSSYAFQRFSDDNSTIYDKDTNITLPYYIRVSMMMFSITLILEAASRLESYYSKEFYEKLSHLSPIPFNKLKTISVEEKIWSIVKNQLF